MPFEIIGSVATASEVRADTTAPAVVKGRAPDGASAIGVILDAITALVTAGAKLVSFRSAGVEKAAVGKGGEILATNGTAALPGLSFLGDPDTGWRCSAANQMSGVFGGVESVVLSGSVASFASGAYVVDAQGQMHIANDDASGSPGDCTIDKPAGFFALASGTKVVVITNELIQKPCACYVSILNHEDGLNVESAEIETGTATIRFSQDAVGDVVCHFFLISAK